jgi:glycerol dehydrogenase
MLEGKPRSMVDQVLGFSAEVGLPMTLAEVGLGEMTGEMLQQIATRSTVKGETIHNEPFDVRPELVSDAIRAADATGRAWKKKNGFANAVRA